MSVDLYTQPLLAHSSPALVVPTDVVDAVVLVLLADVLVAPPHTVLAKSLQQSPYWKHWGSHWHEKEELKPQDARFAHDSAGASVVPALVDP